MGEHRAAAEITLDRRLFHGEGGIGVWHKIPIDHGRITLWVMAHPDDMTGTLRFREGDNADWVTLPGQGRLPGDSGLFLAAEGEWEFGRFVIWSEGHE